MLIDFIFELGYVCVAKGLEVGVSVFVEFLLGLLDNLVQLLFLDTGALSSVLIDAIDHGNGNFVESLHVFLCEFLKHVFFSLLNSVVKGILHEDSKETGLVLQIFLETFKELSILLDEPIIELVSDGGTNTSIFESLEVLGFRLSLVIILHDTKERLASFLGVGHRWVVERIPNIDFELFSVHLGRSFSLPFTFVVFPPF